MDERTLYVADTGLTHDDACAPDIRAYDLNQGLASNGRHFATCPAGLFDGFRVDWHGNVWASSADSVRAYAPDGTPIGRMQVPELVSNLCFGGPKRNRLFITAQTSLYAIYLNTSPHEATLPACKKVSLLRCKPCGERSGRPVASSPSQNGGANSRT